MTIRTRLWVSHLISLVVPILATLLISIIALVGLYAYIQKGNYIYVEKISQFNNANQIVTFLTLRDLRHDDHLVRAPIIYRLFDPRTTYIRVLQGSHVIYLYGNASLEARVPAQIMNASSLEGAFANSQIYFMTATYRVNGLPYTITMSATKPIGMDDRKVEWFFKVITFCIFIVLILSIWFITYFLTGFAMRHILRPLRALTRGAKEVAKGNLSTYVDYTSTDEFMPITRRFNAMIESLRHNEDERLAQEQSRRELIAGISHDLRTPLTSIKAYVEALADGIAPSEEIRQRYLKTIQAKTNDIDRLLEQLFLFSKLDLGAEALHVEPVELQRFLTEYVRDNHEFYESKGLALHLHCPEVTWVKADWSVLVRIIENILTNSVKYKGKPSGESTITLTQQDGRAHLTIADDGPGVKPENLDRLFEVFYRTDKARANTTEGSGLGLAIAAKYLALIGGNIKASNVTPHGLCMTITIPLQEPPAKA